jgi:hypothetical protein
MYNRYNLMNPLNNLAGYNITLLYRYKVAIFRLNQCFGSALIVCGSRYGSVSSILDECGSGYASGSSADPDSGKI